METTTDREVAHDSQNSVANTTLFFPVEIGAVQAANRVFMAPMTRLRAAADGTPTQLMVEYYQQRASAGLIVTEGTYLDQSSNAYTNQPGIETDAHIGGWREVTSAVKSHGGLMALQLHHSGRITHPDLIQGELPVAPSAVKAEGEIHTPSGKKHYVTPRALERQEIEATINTFVTSAQNAIKAGFDFVEIHAANGYLPHTFLSNRTNLREDDYGGSIENRSRFVVEVTKAVSDAVGSQRVGIKFNIGEFPPHDINIDDEQELFPYLAKELQKIGIAYIHVQQPITNWGISGVSFNPLALFRPHYKGRLISGGALDLEKAKKMVAENSADAATFGRAWLANSDLIERFKVNAPLNEANPDTFYNNDEKGYIDYPALK